MRVTQRDRIGNLPEQPTSFVGRPRQLADAAALLGAGRLVTLTGPAGVGKTRLALKTAAAHQRAYPDGVWLVELASLNDPRLLAQTIAAALGLRDQAGKPPLSLLTEFFRPRHLLFVMDNCEHLIDACADIADRLLRDCPSLRILVTSREPLGISGETILMVPPLDVPDPQDRLSPKVLVRYSAVALFMDRVRTGVPMFELAVENHRAVAAICHRLDGLPLAIELAAPWLKALTPHEILDRLANRRRLLTMAPHDGPARHQTLRACIEWSFDLCTAAERTLWARLAVLAGSFEIDAAEGICADERLRAEDVLDLVRALIDKSILLADTSGEVARYRLLETIREYGLEQLSSGR